MGQRKLAKVSGTPGRTRSLNFFKVDNRYYFVDLPGYGYAKVSKSMRAEWGKLIEDYLTNTPELIGLVLLLDCRRESTDQDLELLEWLAERKMPVMLAVTKADKLSKHQINVKLSKLEAELGVPAVATSTVTGIGRKSLLASIRQLVDDHMEQLKAKPNG
jgi:GTP-binding protein